MSRRTVLTLLALLPAAAAAASGSTDPFDAPAAAAVSFAESGALAVTFEQLEAEAVEVVILNGSPGRLELNAVLDGPAVRRRAEDGTTSRVKGLLVLACPRQPQNAPGVDDRGNARRGVGPPAADPGCEPAEPQGLRLTLAAAGSQRIEIRARQPLDTEGVVRGRYTGYLALHNSATILRRPIVLTHGPGPVRPAFDKWTIHLTRTVPFTAMAGAFGHLPLSPVGEAPTLPRRVGRLAAEQSQAAEVFWTAVEQGRARVELRGLDRFTSKYEGSVQLAPAGDPAGKVVLTVMIKDHWLLAVICLGLGIWAAKLLVQFVQVRRAVWLARERNAQLGIDFGAARERFRRIASGGGAGAPAWAAISIAEEMADRREELREWLGRLEALYVPAIEQNEEFKAARDELDRLEAATAAWPAFAGELAALDAARGEIRRARPSPPPLASAEQLEPACLRLADRLLEPVELSLSAPDQPATRPRFLERRPQVVAAGSTLGGWLRAERQLQEQRDIAARLLEAVAPNHPERAEVERIADELEVEWGRLWRVDSAPALTEVSARLYAILDRMAPLADHLPKEHPRLDRSAHPAEVVAAPPVAAPPTEAERMDDRERRDYYAGLRRRYEGVTLVVAFALALVSGLNALYIGKEFATVWHYVQALTWGAGTKLALDTVVAAIGHLPGLARAVSGGR